MYKFFTCVFYGILHTFTVCINVPILFKKSGRSLKKFDECETRGKHIRNAKIG